MAFIPLFHLGLLWALIGEYQMFSGTKRRDFRQFSMGVGFPTTP